MKPVIAPLPETPITPRTVPVSWILSETDVQISLCVEQLIGRESTEGESAKNKGASVKGKFLLPLMVLLSDLANRLNFPEAVCGNSSLRKERIDPRENGIA
jgi:hypothetical protein